MGKRRLGAIAGLVAAATCARASAAEPSRTPDARREVVLRVNEEVTVDATGVRQYAEGTPGVVEVHAAANPPRLVMRGTRPGMTTLLLVAADGSRQTMEVWVHTRPVDEVERAVSLALVHNPAFQVRRVGWRLFIVGTAANPYEADRVRDVAERYAGMVELIVELCRCPR